jgi:hypothetical protein
MNAGLFGFGVDQATIGAPAVFKRSIAETVVTSVAGARHLVDTHQGTIHKITLTGNTTLQFPKPYIGGGFTLFLTQDATGSRTVTWPSSVLWPSGSAPATTATAGRTDVISFVSPDGLRWWGFTAGLNFA